MENEKPMTEGQKKFVNYFLIGCTVVGVAIAVYFIKHPEVIHPKQKPLYENTISISNAVSLPDLNGDSIPDLKVWYNDKSIDTLLSQKDGQRIHFK
jgi:hypothetical protein